MTFDASASSNYGEKAQSADPTDPGNSSSYHLVDRILETTTIPVSRYHYLYYLQKAQKIFMVTIMVTGTIKEH